MLVTISQKELNRIPLLQRVCDKFLTQLAAAKLLNLSVRQFQRILVRYLSDGAAGIVSRKRGKPANNRVSDDLRLQVLVLLRENYSDFGPTLATEKLCEVGRKQKGCQLGSPVLNRYSFPHSYSFSYLINLIKQRYCKSNALLNPRTKIWVSIIIYVANDLAKDMKKFQGKNNFDKVAINNEAINNEAVNRTPTE